MATQDEATRLTRPRQGDRPPAGVRADPVLSALGEAEARYRDARDEWEAERAALLAARARAEDRADEAERLRAELERLRGEHAELREQAQRAERERRRARQLAEGLKEIHRALFDGNIYSLVLRACAAVTGATRGLYVTAWGEDRLQPRAALDLPPYPQAPPSEFIRALCRRAIDGGRAFISGTDGQALPPPGPGEQFRNFLVAPAVVMARFSGVVILADKAHGDFTEEDAEQVLGVGDQAGVAVENRLLRDQLMDAYFSVVGVLADAIEAKDPYTHGHCEMVARLGRLTAQRLGLDEGLVSVACFGGLLHDVGKIGVSDGVLNKPGKLLPEEWDLMRSHVRIGRDLLGRVPAMAQVADVVLHHHERVDGAGYPDGLRGEQISPAARIIAVVDAYSAMTSKRSYKDSMTDAEARAELLRCKGTHFDPDVVDAFLSVLDSPPQEDDCPDGCGLPPSFYHAQELRLALEGLFARRREGGAGH